MRSTLRSARVRRILAAYTVNEVGTWLGYLALTVGVYHETHSGMAVAGLLVAGRLLPALATPALVARFEVLRSRGALTRLYIAEALITAGLALFLSNFVLAAIFALVALDAGAAFTANALLRAAIAHVAAEETEREIADSQVALPAAQAHEAVALAQRSANAQLNLAFTLTVAVGPVVGGVFVATAGGPTALLVDAVSFLICGLLLIDVRVRREDTAETTVTERLRAAWVHIAHASQLRALLIAEALVIVFFSSAEPVEVVYAVTTLRAGYGGLGLLLAVWGVGMVLGGVLFARMVRQPLGPMITAGTFAVGLSYIGFALAPTLAVACVAAVVGGVGNGVQWASLVSAVQVLTPQQLHARLMGVVESIRWLCPGIGALVGGALVTLLASPRQAFFVAGLVAVAMTGVFLRISATSLSRRQLGVALGGGAANAPPSTPTG